MTVNKWTSPAHARAYLERADRCQERQQGFATLAKLVPIETARLLDLGTGDGRLLAMLLADRPRAEGVGVDFSPLMLDAARNRFAGDARVELFAHDLSQPLPDVGRFDAVVSSFAIHHVPDARKQALFAEVFALLRPAGVFANLEHVRPLSQRAHQFWMTAMERGPEQDDPSDLVTDTLTQVVWLRETGFVDVDCYWQWFEFALIAGWKPG